MQKPEHCGSMMAAGMAGAVQAQAILTDHFF